MNKQSKEAQAQMAKFNIAKLLEERFAKALWETAINFALPNQWVSDIKYFVLPKSSPSGLGITPMQFYDLVKKFMDIEPTASLTNEVDVDLNLAEFAALSNFLETLTSEQLQKDVQTYAVGMIVAYELAVKWNEQAAAVRKATEEAVIAEMQGEKAEENVGTLKAVTAEA